MSQALLRRIRALEEHYDRVSQIKDVEHEIEELWPQIESLAVGLGIAPQIFADEFRTIVRRRAEIGDDAFYEEFAEETGIPLQTVRDPAALQEYNDRMDREWDEWKSRCLNRETVGERKNVS